MIKIEKKIVQFPNATGNIDYTIPGFGTPKAVLFLIPHDIEFFPNSYENDFDSQFQMGASDGIRQWSCLGTSKDGNIQTATNSEIRNDVCIDDHFAGSSASRNEASFVSWITDGVRVNFTNATDDTYFIMILIGGDVTARADYHNVGATIGTLYNYTSMGFEPDLLFTAMLYGDLINNTDSAKNISFGFVTNDRAGVIDQNSISHFTAPALATSKINLSLCEDCGLSAVNAGGSIQSKFVFSNFSSTGFGVTPNINADSTDICFLAIKFDDDRPVKVKSQLVHDNNNTKNLVGYGFKPEYAFSLMTLLDGLNFCGTDQKAQSMSIGFANDAAITLRHCSMLTSDGDNLSTTSCKNGLSNNDGWSTFFTNPGLQTVDRVSSYISDGIAFQHSDCGTGTDRYLSLLLIGEIPAVPTTADIFPFFNFGI